MGTTDRRASGIGPGVAAVVLLAALACRSTVDPRLHFQGRGPLETPLGSDVVRVTFLGTQGFLLEWNGHAVLTAPFYSNPQLGDVLEDKPLVVNEALIDQLLPSGWLADVEAILVGHSHYDHLMDVPYVARTKAPRATVYGSRTAVHLVASALDPQRLRSVSSSVDYRMCPGLDSCAHDNAGQEGAWITVAGNPDTGVGVRIRALCSKHSPQVARRPPLWPGCRTQDEPLPDRPSEWVLGDTVAYLIDFLQDGRPVFRTYYQDSATDPRLGYVHESLIAERPADLALLCAGAFDQVEDNPAGIIGNTRPKHILLGHWDDFFRPQPDPLQSLPFHDLPVLVKALAAATGAPPFRGRYRFPAPGAVMRFAVEP